MKKIDNTPVSLKEIWEIKEKAYEEVKDLSIKSALKKRLNSSIKTTFQLGYIELKPSRIVITKKT